MVKAMSSSQGQRDLKDMAIGFIRKQSTMTLATCKEGKPWAAPVYFVFFKSSFYFFSDPCCRHISESTENRRVSASIHGVASTWQEIRGLQMSGEIQRVGMGLESAEAIAAYLRKFNFTRDFFSSGTAPNLEDFSSRFRVKLYKFVPFLVYYLDNSLAFGFREPVTL